MRNICSNTKNDIPARKCYFFDELRRYLCFYFKTFPKKWKYKVRGTLIIPSYHTCLCTKNLNSQQSALIQSDIKLSNHYFQRLKFIFCSKIKGKDAIRPFLTDLPRDIYNKSEVNVDAMFTLSDSVRFLKLNIHKCIEVFQFFSFLFFSIFFQFLSISPNFNPNLQCFPIFPGIYHTLY